MRSLTITNIDERLYKRLENRAAEEKITIEDLIKKILQKFVDEYFRDRKE